jgi:hypothetical protein
MRNLDLKEVLETTTTEEVLETTTTEEVLETITKEIEKCMMQLALNVDKNVKFLSNLLKVKRFFAKIAL